MDSEEGIKRNLKFYFDITICEVHDLPVTVQRYKHRVWFLKDAPEVSCSPGAMFIFSETLERAQQPVKDSFSCGQRRI